MLVMSIADKALNCNGNESVTDVAKKVLKNCTKTPRSNASSVREVYADMRAHIHFSEYEFTNAILPECSGEMTTAGVSISSCKEQL